MSLGAAVRTAVNALAGAPHLLADYVVDRVVDLDPGELWDLGFRHIIFDYDNTLAPWGRRDLPHEVARLFTRLLDGGLTVAVASNGFSGRFGRLAREWDTRGIRFVGGCGKPDPARLMRLLAEQRWDPQATLMVGDNFLTDVAAGRGAGCSTALARPISPWEAPPTKIWRLLEAVHRLRRPEWAGVPRLGKGAPPSRARGWGPVGLALVMGAATLYLAPMVRPGPPGSEASSYSLGMARALRAGWPTPSPEEPERSLLVMALLSRVTNPMDPPPVLAVIAFALLMAGIAGCCVSLLGISEAAAVVCAIPIVLAPATAAASGELSPAIVELALVGAALALAVTPMGAGIVFFLSLLNGLSAVIMVPVLLVRASRRRRRGVAWAMALAGLLAAGCWTMALSRPTVASPSLDSSLRDPVAGFCSLGHLAEEPFSQRIAAMEEGLWRGLLGRTGVAAPLPLLTLATLCSLVVLVPRVPGLAIYVAGRTMAALLLPGLFLRELTLVLLVPGVVLAMGSVFGRALRGKGPLIFVLGLVLALLPQSHTARRQVTSARLAYRAGGELKTIAQMAATLPYDARIATLYPAFVHLVSRRSTVVPRGEALTMATHAIAPRIDPVDDECIATRSLMLCPRSPASGE